MDLARICVRTVVRAFYETQHIVLVDALVNHSALSVADLALVMDMGASSQKIVQKLLGRLREGGLVSTFTRQEIREGATKPINREYFYIDYRKAIDATKYRVHMLDEKVKLESKPSQEKMELRCPRCKSEYTIMDVMDNVDPEGRGSGFLCKRCDSPLAMITGDATETDGRDDTPAKFNKQFGIILTLLQQIDNAVIPEVTGQQALDNQVPVPRNELYNPATKSVPVPAQAVKPTAVRGLATGPEKIEISITTDADFTAEEAAAELERKSRLAAQNQLPEWISHSTINGDVTTAGMKANNAALENSLGTNFKSDEQEEKKKQVDDTLMDSYYSQLAEEMAQERERAQTSTDASEEEEDDEFEDVSVAAPPSAEDTPNAKRIKMEEPAASTPAPLTNALEAGADGESDEDEFEDAI